MIVNIGMTAVPKCIFVPVIHIMDFAPVGINNSASQGCNYLVLIPLHSYLLDSNPCKTLRNSVDYVIKNIVWYLTHVIPVVFIMASHLRWVVSWVCSLYIYSYVDTFLVRTSAATDNFIMGALCIHKTRDILCKNIVVFSCEPNCTLFVLSLSTTILSITYFFCCSVATDAFTNWEIFPVLHW